MNARHDHRDRHRDEAKRASPGADVERTRAHQWNILRGAGLVARPVAQEIGQLLLRLGLVCDIARALQALGARDRRHHRGEVGELRGLKRDKLVAGLRRLEGA